MTDIEKAKAEEYCKKSKDFVKYTSETYRRRLGKAYIDGLKAGRKESEQEINRLNWEIKEIIEDNDYYQHENAELQQRNDAQAESIANYMASIEKLNEKIKGLEAGEVCWQGDMDATIAQNLELKEKCERKTQALVKLLEQIEKMKNCNNCRYNESSKKQNICTCNYCCNDCNKWELADSAD